MKLLFSKIILLVLKNQERTRMYPNKLFKSTQKFHENSRSCSINVKSHNEKVSRNFTGNLLQKVSFQSDQILVFTHIFSLASLAIIY